MLKDLMKLIVGVIFVTVMIEAKPALEKTGQIGGLSNAIAAVGNYTYTSYGASLSVFDTTDPLNWIEKGRIDTGSVINDIAVAGDYVYVTNSLGLVIIDISDRNRPQITGELAVSSNYISIRLAVAGDYAYLVNCDHLYIVDIRDKRFPRKVGNYEFDFSSGKDIEVEGDFAYLLHNETFEIIDISNKTLPVSTASVTAGGIESEYDTVLVEGNYAYITHAYSTAFIYDIRDKNTPRRVSEIGQRGSALLLEGNRLYQEGNDGLFIYDVSDRSDPHNIGHIGTPVDSGGVGMALQGDSLFVAGGTGGSWIYNVETAAAPRLVKRRRNIGDIYGFAAENGYAYTVSDAGIDWSFTVIDTHNKKMPEIAGYYEPEEPMLFQGPVAVKGKYAYIGDENYSTGGAGITILDITDKSMPVKSGRFGFPYDENCSAITAMTVTENHAYVGCFNGYYYYSLYIVDISNKHAPSRVASYHTQGEVMDIEISGDFAYISGDYSFEIIDISNPDTPAGISQMKAGYYWIQFALKDGYAYFTGLEYNKDLTVVNTSDPANPYIAGTYGFHYVLGGDLSDIVIDHTTVYGTSPRVGISLFDVTDKRTPDYIDTYDTMNYVGKLAVDGNYLYVSDRYNGVNIWKKTEKAEGGFLSAIYYLLF